MQVKITPESTRMPEIRDLKPGQVFRYAHCAYIKTENGYLSLQSFYHTHDSNANTQISELLGMIEVIK